VPPPFWLCSLSSGAVDDDNDVPVFFTEGAARKHLSFPRWTSTLSSIHPLVRAHRGSLRTLRSAMAVFTAYVHELETEVQRLRASVAPPAYVDATDAPETTPAAMNAPPYHEVGDARNEADGQLAVRSPLPTRPGKQVRLLRWKSRTPEIKQEL
jgi:hypothetical protein